MSQRTEEWLQQRAADWQKLEASLPAMEDNKQVSYRELRRIIHVYPELARDVAVLRREAPGARTTSYLERIYQRCHRVLFKPPGTSALDVATLMKTDVPEIAYSLRWQIFSVALLFVFGIAVGAWLVSTYPELAALFASEGMIEEVQSGKLWTDGLLNVVPSSLLSVQILTNNIMVALTAMCLGTLYGIGTLYIIGLNGLMLGGVFALTAQYGLGWDLFDFVIAHGCVELSVIVVAGAIGFSIGESIARPGSLSRGAAFRLAVQRGVKLMVLCVVFLFGAGFIEGYVSPNDSFPRNVRIAIGLAYWCLFLFALCGWRLPTIARKQSPEPTV
ncbi:MAG: stage II sporulation protein M [Halioglobus sp.]